MNASEERFAQVPHWVLPALVEHDPASARSTFAVFGALSRYADRAGTCWPSHARLAADTGLHAGTVRRCLALLVEVGALTVESGATAGRTNLYQICLGGHASVREGVARGGARGSRVGARRTTPREPDPENTRERARDEVWDALVAVWGEPVTKVERSKLGKVVRDLKREGLTDPAELTRRGRLARQRWDEAQPFVLLSRWRDLGGPPRSVHDSVADLEQRRRAQ